MKKKKSRSPSFVTKLQLALTNTFIPHHTNGYRPHLIRNYGITAVVVFVVALQIGYNVSQTGEVLGLETDVSQTRLLVETNAARQSQNEPTLHLNTTLNQAATLKAKDMFARQYWAHDAPDGTAPWAWFEKVHYKYDYAGENLAKGFSSANSVVTAWMNSPDHRKNLLSDNYKDVGFGIASGKLKGEDTMVVVALYGATAASAAEAPISASGSKVLAAINEPTSFVSRLGIGVQSMTPAAVGSAMLLLLVAAIAVAANASRHLLPASVRKTWLRHHGLYKATGMLSLVVVLIALYGGGQI